MEKKSNIKKKSRTIGFYRIYPNSLNIIIIKLKNYEKRITKTKRG